MKKLWEKVSRLISQGIDGMKKLGQRVYPLILQLIQRMQRHWQAWSRRKRVTVCTLSALAVLIAGATIFCLTVPLFYWWPDNVPIPGTNGTMMFVKESDPEREYCRAPDVMNFSFPIALIILLADDDELENLVKAYEEYHVSPPLNCGITVTKIRKLDHKLSTGEWLETSIAEMEIRREVFDPLDEVRVGERILVYTYNRSDRIRANTGNYEFKEGVVCFVDLRRIDEIEEFRELYKNIPHNDFQKARKEEEFKQFEFFTWLPIPKIVAEYSNYPRGARFPTNDEWFDVPLAHLEPAEEKWKEFAEKRE